MCILCRLRGPLVNCDDNGNDVDFDISGYYNFDCQFNVNGENLIDSNAQLYLQDTLEAFLTLGLSLKAAHVSHDGSCLPHAISTSLIGKELLFDGLRACLVRELVENEDWYRKNTDIGRTTENDATWQREWSKICAESQPTRGAAVGPDRYLGDIHILAFANLLGRPILLLDNLLKMSISGTEGHGLFPPLRHSREDIISMHSGRIPGILTIAMANKSSNHYVSILNSAIDDFRNNLTSKKNGNVLTNSSFYNNFSSFILEQTSINQELKELGDCFTVFILQSSPTIVSISAKTLLTILQDVNKYADNLPGNSDSCLELKIMDNKILNYNVFSVPNAMQILLVCGYDMVTIEDKIILRFGCRNRLEMRDLYCVETRKLALASLKMILAHCNSYSSSTGTRENGSSSSSSDNSSFLCLFPGFVDLPGDLSSTLLGMPSIFNEYNEDRSPRTSSVKWFNDVVQRYGVGSHKPNGGIAWSIGGFSVGYHDAVNELRTALDSRFYNLILRNHYLYKDKVIFKSCNDLVTCFTGPSNIGAVVVCKSCSHTYYWCSFDPNETNSEVTILELLEIQIPLKEARYCPKCSIERHTVHNTYLLSVFDQINNIFTKHSEESFSVLSSAASLIEMSSDMSSSHYLPSAQIISSSNSNSNSPLRSLNMSLIESSNYSAASDSKLNSSSASSDVVCHIPGSDLSNQYQSRDLAVVPGNIVTSRTDEKSEIFQGDTVSLNENIEGARDISGGKRGRSNSS